MGSPKSINIDKTIKMKFCVFKMRKPKNSRKTIRLRL